MTMIYGILEGTQSSELAFVNIVLQCKNTFDIKIVLVYNNGRNRRLAMHRWIAFFDFDGTITAEETFYGSMFHFETASGNCSYI